MLGVMLPWLGGGGFNFVDLLRYLEDFGFFSYFLPFLLVFAVVFAILQAIPIFQNNKGAGVIIALAIGFLSLVGGAVPTFFSTIFPNFGVGMSIVLVGLLLAGAFIPSENAFKWIFFGLGGLIFLFVLFSSLSGWQFFGQGEWQYWWHNFGGLIIVALGFIGVVVAVVVANKARAPGHP